MNVFGDDNMWDALLDEQLEGVESGASRALVEYQGRPLDFAVDVLCVERGTLVWSDNPGYEDHEWIGTPDPMAVILDAIGNWRNVGVESAIGPGKTYLAAIAMYYMLGCVPNSQVLVSGPRQGQTDRLMRAASLLWPKFKARFPQARLLGSKVSGEVRMLPGQSLEWRAWTEVVGVGAEDAFAGGAQGVHGEHLLIIVDEMAATDHRRVDPYLATLTGKNILMGIGNPDSPEDPLHLFCKDPSTVYVQVSARDHPNYVTGKQIVPGACDRKSVSFLQRKLETQPALRDSRIDGVSPDITIGAVYEYDPKKHTSPYTYHDLVLKVREEGWPVIVGVDTGKWRFAQIISAVDAQGRCHVMKELWSSLETTDDRMKALVDALRAMGLPLDHVPLYIYHDPGGGPDTIDLRAAMKRAGWHGPKIRPASKKQIKGSDNLRVRYREASYQRIADLLARGQLLFAKDLGAGLEWRLGASTANTGQKREGSRLLWELKMLKYPDKPGRAQQDDPDEDTADGADMIAALRFIAMQVEPRLRPIDPGELEDRAREELLRAEELARPAPFPRTLRDLPRDGPNRDRGLERQSVMRQHLDPAGQFHRRVPEHLRKKMVQRALDRRRTHEERRAARSDTDTSIAGTAALGPLMDAIERSGLTPEEAADRLLGL